MLLHCKCIDNYVNTKSFRKKIKEIVQKERKTAFQSYLKAVNNQRTLIASSTLSDC